VEGTDDAFLFRHSKTAAKKKYIPTPWYMTAYIIKYITTFISTYVYIYIIYCKLDKKVKSSIARNKFSCAGHRKQQSMENTMLYYVSFWCSMFRVPNNNNMIKYNSIYIARGHWKTTEYTLNIAVFTLYRYNITGPINKLCSPRDIHPTAKRHWLL